MATHIFQNSVFFKNELAKKRVVLKRFFSRQPPNHKLSCHHFDQKIACHESDDQQPLNLHGENLTVRMKRNAALPWSRCIEFHLYSEVRAKPLDHRIVIPTSPGSVRASGFRWQQRGHHWKVLQLFCDPNFNPINFYP